MRIIIYRKREGLEIMNTALEMSPSSGPTLVPDNVLYVDFSKGQDELQRRSTSLYKSNGQRKATAAEPIRQVDDIKAIQDYYLSKGQLRNYTIFTVGILFGLRASDLLSLKIHHIFEPDGRFKSHCDLIESKTRKFNNPAITPQIQHLLSDYLATRTDIRYDDPLFTSREKNKDGSARGITIHQFNNVLKKAARECKVAGHISSHSLRKTFAYQILQQNPDDDTAKFALQKMLNHNDFKTTLTYCGLAQDAMDDYRAGLEGVVV